MRIREAKLVNPNTASRIARPCGETLNSAATLQPKPSSSNIIKPGQLEAQQINSSASSGIGQLLNPNICDGTYCVNLPAVAASVRAQLDCNVVGYAFFAGNALTGAKSYFGAWGEARTNANKPSAAFTPDSKIQIASTSKVLTALMALKAISSKVNNLAYSYFPSDWTLPQNSIVKNITIRQFISQTSGVQQYYAGPNGQDYADLKTFFTQSIPNPGAAYSCPFASGNIPISNPIISDTKPCYTDTNFGLMRIVLSRAAGATNSNDPQMLADSYVKLVQDNVLAPVGVIGDACKQPSSNYALSYNFPGSTPGTNFSSPQTLTCGDWGWWLSVRDYARVLVSLNSQDGKILGNCGLYDMVTNPSSHPVGWDITSDGTHRWIEKNGGDSWGTNEGSGQMSSSVGLYIGKDGCVVKGKGVAPVPGVAAVLFINSNLRGSDPAGVFNNAIGGTGALSLSGSLVSGGTAKFGIPHYVIAVSSKNSDKTQTLTITGTLAGSAVTDMITLNGTKAVWSGHTYDTVTKIVAGGSGYSTAGTITIGTNGIGADSVLIKALQAGTAAE